MTVHIVDISSELLLSKLHPYIYTLYFLSRREDSDKKIELNTAMEERRWW